MSKRTILVSGASGFIGGRIVERLALEQDESVRAWIRSWSRAARPARLAVDVTVGDVMNYEEVVQAVRGCTHVVHCAYSSDPRVIVDGTRNVLTAAAEGDIDRFVFLSTAEVYGSNAKGLIDEATPATPCGHTYADAKIEAEQLCQEFCRSGLPMTILRPSIVYGPFGAAWTVGIAKRLQSGHWGQFQQYGSGHCNAVYVDDMVSAVLLAIDRPAAIGHTFNVNGPDNVTWNEYFSRFNNALGLPPLDTKSAAASAARTAVVGQLTRAADAVMRRYGDRLMKVYLRGGAMSNVMRRVKTLLQATPSAHELNSLFSRQAIYSDAKARQMLGYNPQFGLDRGLALAALWLADGGFIELPTAADVDTSDDGAQQAASIGNCWERAAAGHP